MTAPSSQLPLFPSTRLAGQVVDGSQSYEAVQSRTASRHVLQPAAHTHLMKIQPLRLDSSANHNNTHTHKHIHTSVPVLTVVYADNSNPLIWLTHIQRLRMIKCYTPNSHTNILQVQLSGVTDRYTHTHTHTQISQGHAEQPCERQRVNNAI